MPPPTCAFRNRPRRVSKEDKAAAELLRRRTFVPFRKWAIKLRDQVQVNGGKHAGLRGQVVAREEQLGTVALDLSAQDLDAKQSFHYSRVSLVDPATDRMTKVKWRYLESGERVRIAKSGAVVPVIPREVSEPTAPPKSFAPSATRRDEVLARTYVPLPGYSLRAARRDRLEQSAAGGGAEEAKVDAAAEPRGEAR